MQICKHRGKMHAELPSESVQVFECPLKRMCLDKAAPFPITFANSTEQIPVCSTSCDGYEASEAEFVAPVGLPTEIKPWTSGTVGTKLSEVLVECGIHQSEGCQCKAVANWMDQIGIDGCKANRAAIIQRLKDASHQAGWLDWLKVAAHGYLSYDALLDEAFKRASAA